jgi:hypothetical protein
VRFGKFDPKKVKNWITKDKQYRIYWRSEAFGIKLPPRFFAFKWDGETWTFATVKRPFKTLTKAIAECEKDAWKNLQPVKPKRKSRKNGPGNFSGSQCREDLPIVPGQEQNE